MKRTDVSQLYPVFGPFMIARSYEIWFISKWVYSEGLLTFNLSPYLKDQDGSWLIEFFDGDREALGRISWQPVQYYLIAPILKRNEALS